MENIGCVIGNWRFAPKDNEKKGAQIDLLLDRDDNIITICEIKYNANEYILNKQYALEVLARNEIFVKAIRTKKQIFTCFITNQKLKDNIWSEEIIDANVISDDLFN